MCSAKRWRQWIKKMDIFGLKSFIRYQNEESYGTLSGGIVSLFIKVLFILLFFWLTVIKIQKKTITFQYLSLKEYMIDATQIHIGKQKMNDFMVGVQGVDFNDPHRYFDVFIEGKQYKKNENGTIQTTTFSIPLTKCNAMQWQQYGWPIAGKTKNYQLEKWLCPPKGLNFTLQGERQFKIFKFAKISLRKCTNNSEHYPNTTCRTDTQINEFLLEKKSFSFKFNLINPVISPNLMQFLGYELKTGIHMYFDTKTTTQANLFFDEYSFITDTTVFPWQEQETFHGLIAQEQYKDKQNYPIRNISKSQYLKFYFRKSDIAHNYSQQYQKLDNVFSYIGGLYNIITSLFSFLYLYSQFCFELKIGEKLFTAKQGSSFGSENVNILAFFGYWIYKLFKCCCTKNWQRMKKYQQCIDEAQRQLNIDLILQKIATLQLFFYQLIIQESLSSLIAAKKKLTISEAKQNRQTFQQSKSIYGKLQAMATQINISQEHYKKRQKDFLDEKLPSKNKSSKQKLRESIKRRLQNNHLESSAIKLKRQVLAQIRIGIEDREPRQQNTPQSNVPNQQSPINDVQRDHIQAIQTQFAPLNQSRTNLRENIFQPQ